MDCIEKPSNNNLTPFDFRCWFIQLKLRFSPCLYITQINKNIECLSGKGVQSNQFYQRGRKFRSLYLYILDFIDSFSFCAEQAPYKRQEASRQRLSKFNIPLYPRDCKFSGCVPNIVKNDDFKYHFNNAFIDSTKASESCSTKSNMALYGINYKINTTHCVIFIGIN